MSPYMKRFVYASLFYLGLAAVIGMADGIGNLGYAATFAHTHFNLLGFMAMIVFGIGYFILPRFNGADLRWPSWVPVHFWLGNVSLVGMVVLRGLYSTSGGDLWNVLFIVCASLQAVSLFMFIVNIWVTLAAKPQPTVATVRPAAATVRPAVATAVPVAPVVAEPTVDSETKISDLVDRAPSIREVLVEQGLKMLAVPGHIDKVRKVGVTIGMAAANHGLDEAALIAAVKAELSAVGGTAVKSAVAAEAVASEAVAAEAVTAVVVDINGETLIGTVLEQYPHTNGVFTKYFGDGCIDCPGQSFESIDLACRMHGVDPELFMEDLRAAAADAR